MDSLIDYLLLVLRIEGQVPDKQHVQNDAETPDVDTFIIRLTLEHLWRCVGDGTDSIFEGEVGAFYSGQTEVHQFGHGGCIVVRGHHHVLKFQVPVHDAIRVQKLHGLGYLDE